MVNYYYWTGREYKKGESIKTLKRIIRDEKYKRIWVDINNETEEVIEKVLGKIFNFHPLSIEDCIQFSDHPKMDEYNDYLFIIIHSINYYPEQMRISTWELDTFIGKNFIVTHHLKPLSCIKELEKKLKHDKDFIRKRPDELYHYLLDNLVDNYFPVLEQFDIKISEIEDKIFQKNNEIEDEDILNEIFIFRKNILKLRKIIIPQLSIISRLTRGNLKFIHKNTRIYFSDVLDHIIKISGMIDVNFDLIKGALDTYISFTSNKMNEIMKVLTIIATIMMPLTFIAGIYGMNFKYMPEIHSAFGQKYGYFIIMGIMITISLTMIWFFKKKKWL